MDWKTLQNIWVLADAWKRLQLQNDPEDSLDNVVLDLRIQQIIGGEDIKVECRHYPLTVQVRHSIRVEKILTRVLLSKLR